MLAMTNDLKILDRRLREDEKNFTAAASDELNYLVNQVKTYGLDDIYLSDMSYLESKDGCVSIIPATALVTKEGIQLEDQLMSADKFLQNKLVRMISTTYVGRARATEVIEDLKKAREIIETQVAEKHKAQQAENQKPEANDISGLVDFYLKKKP